MQSNSQMNYQDFSFALHQKAKTQRLPTDVMLELTHRCPLACAHCYNNLPMNDNAAHQRELSTNEWCEVLDQLAAAGTLWLCFTGGEILARRDFLEIYTYAKQQGFIITLFTNGTLITEKIADYLTEFRPFSIEITLYGRTKATYEQLTGIPGSFDKCMRGIELLRERGLPLKLKTVAVTINQHEVFEMKQFAEDLGLAFKFDPMMNPRIDCSLSPLATRLTPAEVISLDLHGEERVQLYREKLAQLLNSPPPATETLYQCGGAVNGFAVDPYGQMSLCVLSRQELYDLRQGPVKEGWESFLYQIRQKRRTRPGKCRACALRNFCSTCPATSELEHQDPETPVDFYCHVSHLRARALGFEVPAHGECDYCSGGSHHADLLQSLESLQKQGFPHKALTQPTRHYLPVLQQPPTGSQTGVTMSCGAH